MRFPGIIPAVTTPFDASGAIDFAGLETNVAALLEAGVHGIVATGTMGEAGSLSTDERRAVVAAVARAVDGQVPVIAGVSAGTPAAAIALAADAAEAGAVALMLLPPLGYRGDAEEIVAHYRSVAEAAGLPLMAYNNPEASGIDMPPALLARLYEEIEQVVAFKECSGDARRIPALIAAAPGAEVLVGGDDWALEGFCAGATGWVTGVADVAPADCVALYDACRAGDLDSARAIYQRMLPLARFDMTPKLVQYFKAAMDEVGYVGGPTPPAAAAAHDRRARGARRRDGGASGGRRCMRFEAVDSHTEGMPTRVVTSGVDPIPGATMLERKLYFERELDDLRLLLMREPRGHSAMSGAILQPPTRADADWGVLFIEVSGCLPMCGHGTIGVATVLVETGRVEVREPETVVRLDTPAGLVEARVAVEDGRARAVTLRNVPSFLFERDRRAAGVACDIAFGGNFYALVSVEDVDPARADEYIRRGAEIMAAVNQRPPVHPLDERIAGCRHVVFHSPGRDGADAVNATSIHPGWLDRSPCGTGTSARMAALHARGELALGEPFVNQSLIGTRFTGRLVEETRVGDVPAVVPEITGRAWVTGRAEYVLEADDPFPAGFAL